MVIDFNYLVYVLFTLAWHLAIVAGIMYVVYWAIKFTLRLFEKHWFTMVLIISLIIAFYLGIFDSLASRLLY